MSRDFKDYNRQRKVDARAANAEFRRTYVPTPLDINSIVLIPEEDVMRQPTIKANARYNVEGYSLELGLFRSNHNRKMLQVRIDHRIVCNVMKPTKARGLIQAVRKVLDRDTLTVEQRVRVRFALKLIHTLKDRTTSSQVE